VHVGEHRHAERRAQLGEDRQRLVEPDAARAFGAGAVGLVERGLVDEADAKPRGDLLQRGGHLERVRAALQHAWPGDQASGSALPKRTLPTVTIIICDWDGGYQSVLRHRPCVAGREGSTRLQYARG
jgi:hypothetical protein